MSNVLMELDDFFNAIKGEKKNCLSFSPVVLKKKEKRKKNHFCPVNAHLKIYARIIPNGSLASSWCKDHR